MDELPSPFPPTRWFGTHWSTPELDYAVEIRTPVGRACAGCGEPIEDGDDGYAFNMPFGATDATVRGVPFHRGCHLAGTLSHMAGVCRCARPDISERERGRLTVAWVESSARSLPAPRRAAQ